MPNRESSQSLRVELEHAIRAGRCAYCRRPASPESPLTREHVIPRAKGGSRKDARIIVPACARCNHRKGDRLLSELGWHLSVPPAQPPATVAVVMGWARREPSWQRYLDPAGDWDDVDVAPAV